MESYLCITLKMSFKQVKIIKKLGVLFVIIFCGYQYFKGPKIEYYLWTWERSDDLSFASSEQTVAPLIATLIQVGNDVSFKPRRNPFKTRLGAKILPVFRLEAYKTQSLNVAACTQYLLGVIKSNNYHEIQLDFDAKKSQRSAYKELIDSLKKQMPNLKISITALASWCVDDGWIETLDIEYAVPMLYRMGDDAHKIMHSFSSTLAWPVKKCQNNVAFEVQGTFIKPTRNAKVFLFNNKAWSEKDWLKLKKCGS